METEIKEMEVWKRWKIEREGGKELMRKRKEISHSYYKEIRNSN